MSEIIIGGVNLSELKAQLDALQPLATCFIADNLQLALTKFEELLALNVDESTVTTENLADEINTILANIRFVSEVTGVTYYLPFEEEWGYDEEPLSFRLGNGPAVASLGIYNSKSLAGLSRTIRGMEIASRDWHSSTC